MNPLALLFDALTLRTEAFERLKRSPLVFWYGFLAMVIVALLVGLVAEGAEQLERASLRPADRLNQAMAEFEAAFPGVPGDAVTGPMIRGSVREGILMALEIEALPPRGGPGLAPIRSALEFVGRWFGTPFQSNWLLGLLLGGVVVQIGARMLGGKGTFAELVGLGALAFAPAVLSTLVLLINTLDRTTALRGLGPLASLVGFVVTVWQFLIYLRAVSVAHEFTMARALAAVVLALVLIAAASLLLAFGAGALVASLIALLSAGR